MWKNYSLTHSNEAHVIRTIQYYREIGSLSALIVLYILRLSSLKVPPNVKFKFQQRASKSYSVKQEILASQQNNRISNTNLYIPRKQ
jgi:hypothetical protein